MSSKSMTTLLGPLRKAFSGTIALKALIPTEDALIYQSCNLFIKGATYGVHEMGVEACPTLNDRGHFLNPLSLAFV